MNGHLDHALVIVASADVRVPVLGLDEAGGAAEGAASLLHETGDALVAKVADDLESEGSASTMIFFKLRH